MRSHWTRPYYSKCTCPPRTKISKEHHVRTLRHNLTAWTLRSENQIAGSLENEISKPITKQTKRDMSSYLFNSAKGRQSSGTAPEIHLALEQY